MKIRMYATRFILLVCLCLPSISSWAEGAGTITHLGGVLLAINIDGTKKMLSVGSKIMPGDTLKTEVNTYARIKFVDGSEVVLRPETVFKVESYTYNPDQKEQDSFVVNLVKGGLRSVTGFIGKRSPNQFKMRTQAATIGIRGTHFGALLCNNDCGSIQTVIGMQLPNGLHTDTAEGNTVISNEFGSIEVPAGSFSYTAGAHSMPKIVPPSQGIQVTMPTSISYNKSTGGSVDSKKSSACSVK